MNKTYNTITRTLGLTIRPVNATHLIRDAFDEIPEQEVAADVAEFLEDLMAAGFIQNR